LFSLQTLLLATGLVLALALLWVVVFAVAGGDQDPAILAETNAPEPAASATTPAAPGQPGVHGAMPELRKVEVNAALAALKNVGVTPIVIQQPADAGTGQVIAQVPAAGTDLHADVPVLIVVGKGK